MATVMSTITSKNQTTVPRAVREHLGLGPQDVLQWEIHGREVRVSTTRPAFLDRRGSIAIGPGDVVADVQQARRSRGISSR